MFCFAALQCFACCMWHSLYFMYLCSSFLQIAQFSYPCLNASSFFSAVRDTHIWPIKLILVAETHFLSPYRSFCRDKNNIVPQHLKLTRKGYLALVQPNLGWSQAWYYPQNTFNSLTVQDFNKSVQSWFKWGIEFFIFCLVVTSLLPMGHFLSHNCTHDVPLFLHSWLICLKQFTEAVGWETMHVRCCC